MTLGKRSILSLFGLLAGFVFAADSFAATTSQRIVEVGRGSNPCLFAPAMQQTIYQNHFSFTPGFISAKFKECYNARRVPNPKNDPNTGWTAIYKGLVTVQ